MWSIVGSGCTDRFAEAGLSFNAVRAHLHHPPPFRSQCRIRPVPRDRLGAGHAVIGARLWAAAAEADDEDYLRSMRATFDFWAEDMKMKPFGDHRGGGSRASRAGDAGRRCQSVRCRGQSSAGEARPRLSLRFSRPLDRVFGRHHAGRGRGANGQGSGRSGPRSDVSAGARRLSACADRQGPARQVRRLYGAYECRPSPAEESAASRRQPASRRSCSPI